VADEVLLEFDDGVAVFTINRPQARNAVNAPWPSNWRPAWTNSTPVTTWWSA
jgi:enoyl-CoA hydratase/carnithine racemase